MPALGNHDGVDDQIGHILRLQHLRHDVNDGGRGQHAGLYRGHVKIVEYGVDLCGDDGRRQLKHVGDFLRILSRDRRND